MFNKTEKDERDYLARVIEKLEYAIKSVEKVALYSKELQHQKSYLYENKNPTHDWRAPVTSMFYDFEPISTQLIHT